MIIERHNKIVHGVVEGRARVQIGAIRHANSLEEPVSKNKHKHSTRRERERERERFSDGRQGVDQWLLLHRAVGEVHSVTEHEVLHEMGNAALILWHNASIIISLHARSQ